MVAAVSTRVHSFVMPCIQTKYLNFDVQIKLRALWLSERLIQNVKLPIAVHLVSSLT